jgi:hypothetical protein
MAEVVGRVALFWLVMGTWTGLVAWAVTERGMRMCSRVVDRQRRRRGGVEPTARE